MSLSQTIESVGAGRTRERLEDRKDASEVVDSLWVQSLYILKSERWPNSPEKQAAVMSLERIGSCM